jgi:uncharacterized membrane protein YeaQ/YmgE (transglycosylase-associated protein family)
MHSATLFVGNLASLAISHGSLSWLLNAAFDDAVRRTRILEQHMNVLTWLIVGGAVGWLANRILRTDGLQGLVLNVVVGIVGAVGGGWVLSPVIAGDLVVSFSGAMILLVIVNLIRQITAGNK